MKAKFHNSGARWLLVLFCALGTIDLQKKEQNGGKYI
jgi:hypothetical protein